VVILYSVVHALFSFYMYRLRYYGLWLPHINWLIDWFACFVFSSAGFVSNTEIRQLHWPRCWQPQISDEHVVRRLVVYLWMCKVCFCCRFSFSRHFLYTLTSVYAFAVCWKWLASIPGSPSLTANSCHCYVVKAVDCRMNNTAFSFGSDLPLVAVVKVGFTWCWSHTHLPVPP